MVVPGAVMRAALMAMGHLVAVRMFALTFGGVGVPMARLGILWRVMVHTKLTESSLIPYTFPPGDVRGPGRNS